MKKKFNLFDSLRRFGNIIISPFKKLAQRFIKPQEKPTPAQYTAPPLSKPGRPIYTTSTVVTLDTPSLNLASTPPEIKPFPISSPANSPSLFTAPSTKTATNTPENVTKNPVPSKASDPVNNMAFAKVFG